MSIRRKIIKRKLQWLLRSICFIWALTSIESSAQALRLIGLHESLEAAPKHERVLAALRIAEAADAEIRIADRSPAPMLSASLASIDLEHGLGSGPLFNGKSIDKGLGFDWIWERGEKRALRTSVSKAQALALRAEYQESIKQQQLIIIDLFYETLSAQDRLIILNDLAKSAESLVKLATQRFRLGDISAQDLVRLEIEAERASGDLRQSHWLLDRAKLQLRLAVGSPLGPQVAGSANTDRTKNLLHVRLPNTEDASNRDKQDSLGDLSWGVASDWPKVIGVPKVALEKLADETPAVKAAWARLQSAKSQIELARAQDVSDPSYGVGFNHYPGTSKAILGLRASIPLYSKHYFEGEKQRAQALWQVAEAQHAELVRRTVTELEVLYQTRANAYARLTQFEHEMLPKSLKVALQAEQAFAKGGQTLTDLLETRRTLKLIQLEALQWRTEFAKAERAWTVRLDRSTP